MPCASATTRAANHPSPAPEKQKPRVSRGARRYYILYAHIKTGTIPDRIVVGSKLKRGQQIGEIGNTGSSIAPHLHFQVMDRPSALNAIGLPFVFDHQALEGRVVGTANQVNATYEGGGKLRFVQQDPALAQVDRMPAEGQVFGYNQQ